VSPRCLSCVAESDAHTGVTRRGVKATYSSNVGRLTRINAPVYIIPGQWWPVVKNRRVTDLCSTVLYPIRVCSGCYYGPRFPDDSAACRPFSMALTMRAACRVAQFGLPLRRLLVRCRGARGTQLPRKTEKLVSMARDRRAPGDGVIPRTLCRA
jgi:hypothetical protein